MKRLAARLVALALLTGGIVPIMSGVSWACTCRSYPSDRARYEDAAKHGKFIYIATVTDKQVSDDGKTTYYTFAVSDNIKNGVSSPRDVATFTDNATQCGAVLAKGGRTLVVELTEGAVSHCDGTTQSNVNVRAQYIRDAMNPKPTPKPTPTKSKSPTPSPSKSPSKSPTASPSPIPSITLSLSASPSPSATTAAPVESEPESPAPSLDVAAGDESGLSTLQVVIAGLLGVLVLIGGITLMRVTRPQREEF